MQKNQLTYFEKIQLLEDLKSFYCEDFNKVFRDTPSYYWGLTWDTIWLILDLLESFSRVMKKWKALNKHEIEYVLLSAFNDKDFVKEIFEWNSEDEINYTKMWFQICMCVLQWNEEIIKTQKEILNMVWGFEIKTSLI